jgi:hypothetical protein
MQAKPSLDGSLSMFTVARFEVLMKRTDPSPQQVSSGHNRYYCGYPVGDGNKTEVDDADSGMATCLIRELQCQLVVGTPTITPGKQAQLGGRDGRFRG